MSEGQKGTIEYSKPLEEAEAAKVEVAKTEQMLENAQHHLNEMREFRSVLENANTKAEELGIEGFDIRTLDELIGETEQAIAHYGERKDSFEELAKIYESIHEKYESMLRAIDTNSPH